MYDTKLMRYQAGLTSHKILNIEGNALIFKRWNNKDTRIKILVSDPTQWQEGDFVDIFICPTGKTGYRIDFIGRTPENFVNRDLDVITYREV